MGTGRMIISSTHWRQIALVVGLTVAASGCSTIASLDPTGLLGGDSDSSQTSQFPADQAAPTATSDQAVGTTPDLASIPARPAPTSATQQQQTTQSLASDGAQARYSADALRGGTEAAAAPPPASAAAPTAAQQLLGSSATAANAADAPPTAEPPPQVAANAPPPAAAPALPDGAQPAPPANAPIGNAAVPPSSNGGNVQTASMAPAASASPVGPSAAAPMAAPATAPRGEPAVPAVPANTPVRGAMMAQPQLSDAALGFHASDAPPLDASVNEFVSAPIVAHYRQTASNSELASAMTAAAVPAVPARGAGAGPDAAIVTDMAAVSGAPAAIAAMNGGVEPTAVIYFPGDGTGLSTAARAEVRAAVATFKANGGQGAIRVVGHASSRTGNMPVEKHLETIFDKSQARANAVAQELIHDGVPASRVLIDAVGDSQPIYYESMPEGEEGNRRAEIFVQS
jgi:outer membrane protein OmpA-like peptidoglycan-associated protein